MAQKNDMGFPLPELRFAGHFSSRGIRNHGHLCYRDWLSAVPPPGSQCEAAGISQGTLVFGDRPALPAFSLCPSVLSRLIGPQPPVYYPHS